VLRVLSDPGCRSVHEIPRPWPALHSQLPGAVRVLWAGGLLERIANPRDAGTTPAYRATAEGRRVLAVSLRNPKGAGTGEEA
jgi:hypothetical protein